MTGRLVLRTSLTSPFGRKVRIAAEVLGLADLIDIEAADTADPTDSLMRQNPLGKIPCLVLPDGDAVFDSSVIVEYLQQAVETDALVPAVGRIASMTQARLADGIVDAGALIIYEQRYHDELACSQRWLTHQRAKIARALAVFEASPPPVAPTRAVAIGLSCALGFLDRRRPLAWRDGHPRLVAWLADFARAEPAFERTAPPPG